MSAQFLSVSILLVFIWYGADILRILSDEARQRKVAPKRMWFIHLGAFCLKAEAFIAGSVIVIVLYALVPIELLKWASIHPVEANMMMLQVKVLLGVYTGIAIILLLCRRCHN